MDCSAYDTALIPLRVLVMLCEFCVYRISMYHNEQCSRWFEAATIIFDGRLVVEYEYTIFMDKYSVSPSSAADRRLYEHDVQRSQNAHINSIRNRQAKQICTHKCHVMTTKNCSRDKCSGPPGKPSWAYVGTFKLVV